MQSHLRRLLLALLVLGSAVSPTVHAQDAATTALKRAIDEGLVVGPRIYASGAMITITGGHGDFRSRHELPRRLGAPLTIAEELNASQLADSLDEVRMRTREQLLLGASQIKLTAGGGPARTSWSS